MKIKLRDLQHIIGQIKRASPPTTKEAHKLLNNLAVLMEKNSTKQFSPEETLFSEKTEAFHSVLLELCFLRQELVNSYAKEYSAFADQTLEIVKQNDKIASEELIVENDMAELEFEVYNPESCKMLPEIFTRLKNAKEIINEMMNNTDQTKLNRDANTQFELYFTPL